MSCPCSCFIMPALSTKSRITSLNVDLGFVKHMSSDIDGSPELTRLLASYDNDVGLRGDIKTSLSSHEDRIPFTINHQPLHLTN